jgi:hypothetical protein
MHLLPSLLVKLFLLELIEAIKTPPHDGHDDQTYNLLPSSPETKDHLTRRRWINGRPKAPTCPALLPPTLCPRCPMPGRSTCDKFPLLSIANRRTSTYERFYDCVRVALGFFCCLHVLLKSLTKPFVGLYFILGSILTLSRPMYEAHWLSRDEIEFEFKFGMSDNDARSERNSRSPLFPIDEGLCQDRSQSSKG